MAHAVDAAQHADHHDTPSFFRRWFYSTNHKDIGTLYLIFSFSAGLVGSFLSFAMRRNSRSRDSSSSPIRRATTSSSRPRTHHGVLPGDAGVLIGGFGNWFAPLMIGALDMAFPRMNNISFWLTVVGFALLVCSLFVEGAPGSLGFGGSWTVYPPSRPSATPARRQLGILAPHAAGAASILGAINFITTILNMRAPGMTLHKMPLFAWAMLVTAFLRPRAPDPRGRDQ